MPSGKDTVREPGLVLAREPEQALGLGLGLQQAQGPVRERDTEQGPVQGRVQGPGPAPEQERVLEQVLEPGQALVPAPVHRRVPGQAPGQGTEQGQVLQRAELELGTGDEQEKEYGQEPGKERRQRLCQCESPSEP